MKMLSIVSITALAGLAAAANAQVNLDLIKRIDVSSYNVDTSADFIGNNINSVAWDGTNVYVSGFNNNAGTVPTDAGVAKISNVLSTPSFGPAFARTSLPNFRGINSLAIQGDNLAMSHDATGVGSTGTMRRQGLRVWNVASNTQSWAIGDATSLNDNTRSIYGASFDPGFNGAGPAQGVAGFSIGSGRRPLFNSNTGAKIYTFGPNTPVAGDVGGGIINFAVAATSWRDSAFDPATGDLYVRMSNRLGKIVRNADNGFAGPMVGLGGFADAIGFDFQNLAFVNSATAGNFLIANDRTSSGGGQAWNTVMKGLTTGGAAVTLNFLENGLPAVFANGVGAYDFSFHAPTNTLAVSDFANRAVYIFQIPTPGAAALLGLGGLVAFRRRR